jgi:uncharacterized membrane protein
MRPACSDPRGMQKRTLVTLIACAGVIVVSTRVAFLSIPIPEAPWLILLIAALLLLFIPLAGMRNPAHGLAVAAVALLLFGIAVVFAVEDEVIRASGH